MIEVSTLHRHKFINDVCVTSVKGVIANNGEIYWMKKVHIDLTDKGCNGRDELCGSP